jgi:hypothetical protein
MNLCGEGKAVDVILTAVFIRWTISEKGNCGCHFDCSIYPMNQLSGEGKTVNVVLTAVFIRWTTFIFVKEPKY